jgi:hypothetical protein
MVEKMNMFVPLTFLGVSITALCLLGFVLASELRYAFLIAYVVATIFVFALAARTLSTSSLFLLGAAVAVLSVGVEQLLGFMFFPGLVKDLDPFSSDHIVILATLLLVVFGFYFAIALLGKALLSLQN